MDGRAPDSAGATCPQCRRQPVDHKIRFFTHDSAAATAERVPGRAFVKCVCGAWYSYACADVMDAHTPVSQSHVPAPLAVAAPKPVVPPLTAWAPNGQVMDSSDVVIQNYRTRQISPLLWERLTQQRRTRVINSAHLRQNRATDLPPDTLSP